MSLPRMGREAHPMAATRLRPGSSTGLVGGRRGGEPAVRSAWEVMRDDGVEALDLFSIDDLWGEADTPG